MQLCIVHFPSPSIMHITITWLHRVPAGIVDDEQNLTPLIEGCLAPDAIQLSVQLSLAEVPVDVSHMECLYWSLS